MPVNVIDTIKPKNNGSFPVVEAVDVEVSEGLRLPEALAAKADASALAETNAAVATKADASELSTTASNLQSQIDAIISPVTEDSEVINARIDPDGTSHATLKARLDYETSDIYSKLNEASGIVTPTMERGAIAFSSSSASYQTSTTAIRTPQSSNIAVQKGDVVSLTDYSSASFKVAVYDGSSYSYTDFRTADYTCTKDGTLLLVVKFSDSSEVSDISSLKNLIRIKTQNGEIPHLKATSAELTKITNELTEEIEDSNKRAYDLSGVFVPEMEHGAIAFSSSSVSYTTSSTEIRTPQSSNITVESGDIISLTDSDAALFKLAIYNGTSYTYTSYQNTQYKCTKSGQLLLVMKFADSSAVTDVTSLKNLIRIQKQTGAVPALEKTSKELKDVSTILAVNTFDSSEFGVGEFMSGVPYPNIRPYRASCQSALLIPFDVNVVAVSGFRFFASQFVDDEWVNIGWQTSYKFEKDIPFGLVIARTTEDTESIANVPLFVSSLYVEIISGDDNKYTEIDEKISDFCDLFYKTGSVESFLFFTDPHILAGDLDKTAFAKNMDSVYYAYDSSPVSFAMCGGDWMQSGDTPKEACTKLGFLDGEMRKRFKRYYPLVGNHDTNYLGVNDSGVRLPETDWLDKDTLRNIMCRDENSCYYEIKSHTATFYVFNTYTDHDSMGPIRSEQLDWIAEKLNSDNPEHAVFCLHVYYLTSLGSTKPKFTRAIAEIIYAYNSRSVCELSASDYDVEKEYDFTSATGHIDFVLAGHSHADGTDTCGGVPVILTANMQAGGKTTFDLMLIDYVESKVQCVRIGTGYDRTVSF